MKKSLIFLVFLLILNSCANKKAWQKDYKEQLAAFQNKQVNIPQNIANDFYTYYLPSDTQRVNSNYTSTILKFNTTNILLNLNVTGIIYGNQERAHSFLEEGFYNDNKLLFKQEGSYVDSKKKRDKYLCEVYAYANKYLISFFTSNVDFYAYCNLNNLSSVMQHILLLVKTINIKEDAIKKHFVKKTIIDYHKKQLDLFKTVIPKNGYLSDMRIDKKMEEKR